jgi:hypothetical protein
MIVCTAEKFRLECCARLSVDFQPAGRASSLRPGRNRALPTGAPNRRLDLIGSQRQYWGNRGVKFSMPPARLERARPVRAQALNLPCIPIPPRGLDETDYNRFASLVKRSGIRCARRPSAFVNGLELAYTGCHFKSSRVATPPGRPVAVLSACSARMRCLGSNVCASRKTTDARACRHRFQ